MEKYANGRKLLVETTKKGFPAVWEAGGGYTNTGEAIIVAGRDGQPKKPIYIRKRGQLANSKHALIPLVRGDYIIEANHHREDFEISVYRIIDFEEKEGNMFAIVEQVNCFDKNEWDKEPPTFLKSALETAMQKATCYHCREPHFIANIE